MHGIPQPPRRREPGRGPGRRVPPPFDTVPARRPPRSRVPSVRALWRRAGAVGPHEPVADCGRGSTSLARRVRKPWRSRSSRSDRPRRSRHADELVRTTGHDLPTDPERRAGVNPRSTCEGARSRQLYHFLIQYRNLVGRRRASSAVRTDGCGHRSTGGWSRSYRVEPGFCSRLTVNPFASGKSRSTDTDSPSSIRR